MSIISLNLPNLKIYPKLCTSSIGSYERLTDDGLTQWHPAFLKLGDSLEECARKYKGFCQKYKPKEKNTATRCHWGSKLALRGSTTSTPTAIARD